MLQENASNHNRLLFASLAVILFATLLPIADPSARVCIKILCGDRAVADAILNLALFAPFGMALSRSGRPLWFIIVLSAALSAAIELTQLVIPGRNPSVGDFAFNTLGGALGAFALGLARDRLTSTPGSAKAAAAVVGALTILGFGGALLAPAFPDRRYYGQWTPEFENKAHYEGRVLAAAVGDQNVASSPLRDSTVRAQLLRGGPIDVLFVMGAPPSEAAPIFNIYDDLAREVVAIEAEQNDLIVRYRTRGTALRLDQPAFVLRDALRNLIPGTVVQLRVWRVHAGICVRLNEQLICPRGYTPASTSTVLEYIGSHHGMNVLLGLVWIVALFVPAGFYLSGVRSAVLAVVGSAGGLVLVSRLAGIAPPPLQEVVMSAVGLAGGMLLRRRLQRLPGVSRAR